MPYCAHDLSLTGAEGSVADLGRDPVLWTCDECGATLLDAPPYRPRFGAGSDFGELGGPPLFSEAPLVHPAPSFHFSRDAPKYSEEPQMNGKIREDDAR